MSCNDYTQPEEFLNDDSFRKWILSGDNSRQWNKWIKDNPSKNELTEQARLMILAMGVPKVETSPMEMQSSLGETWEKIHKINQVRVLNTRPFWWSGAAAVLVMGVCLTWLFKFQIIKESGKPQITYSELIDQYPKQLIEKVNNGQKPLHITLSDGSSILLQPGGRLSYPDIFDKIERKVYLSGEAFFEISKNPDRPFLVYANEVVTKVLGTSFRIRAYTDQPEVHVTVRTGRVNVFQNSLLAPLDQNELTLLPNESVTFDRAGLAFESVTSSGNQIVSQSSAAIEEFNFEFKDERVSKIFDTIELAYSVKINYPSAVLKDCYLSTSLIDQPLAGKLKIVCESLGNNTRYTVNEDTIKITSTGCN